MPREQFGFNGPFVGVLQWGNNESSEAYLAIETAQDISILYQLYGSPEARADVLKAMDKLGLTLNAPKGGITDPVEALLTALEIACNPANPGSSGYQGLWSGNLTRGDLNRLIASARRARNAIFGADE